jgi:murein DD-endopeptidase MepM/ murein hydrolase activator NlpD
VQKLTRPFADPNAVLVGCAVGVLLAALVLLAAAPAFAQTTAGGTSEGDPGQPPPPSRTSPTQPSETPPSASQPSRTQPNDYPMGFGRRLLRRGCSGRDVRYLQALLNRLGRRTTVDGIYGPGTEAAVRAWETSVNGFVDGRVSRGQAKEMRRRAASGSQSTPRAQEAPSPAGTYVFPIRGSHSFGNADNRFGAPRGGGRSHQGQDILARGGLPVVSVTAGRVSAVGSNGGAGNYAVVAGDDRRDYAYYHLQSSAIVSEGQRVSAGTQLGRVGCTGSCSADHLHFEMWTPHWWDGGSPFDPLPYLRQWDRG